MKKAGGGRLISRERRKTDDETKERRRKEGGIMGIERQTLTRLISAPAVYPQFLSWTLKIHKEVKTYNVKSEQDIRGGKKMKVEYSWRGA